MTRTLVLGPNGQLGGDICDIWTEKGANFVGIARNDLDVTDKTRLQERLTSETFDVLINCTSYHKTDEVEDNSAQAIAVNASAVEQMALICRQKQARFVHISTDYVFGGHVSDGIAFTETSCPAPVNVYGLSKLYGETLASMACPDTSIFRVASLFGIRGASGKGGNFVETMLRVGREKGKLKVVGDQIMSPTATRTIAQSIWTFIQRQGEPGIYHCVNTGIASWYEFARHIIAKAGIDATVSQCSSDEYPTRAKRASFSALDNSKLAQIIGPVPSWQEALDDYLAAKGYL